MSTSSCPGSPHLAHLARCHCDCTVVDVGLNNGDTLAKWLPTVLGGLVDRGGSISAFSKASSRMPPRWVVPPHDAKRPVLERCAQSKDTCYYGFEGNPKFDGKLKRMAHILRLRPVGLFKV